jgi:uncharacterized ion transporter superfamily protein YfcC
MDTILYEALKYIQSLESPFTAILLIFLIVNVFNALIPSGSAKAFLIMPVIYEICRAVEGITSQTAVLAFIFGDGLSSLIWPTNPGLLFILGLTTVSYGKWIKTSSLVFILLFAAMIGLLYIAVAIGYS